MKKTRNKRAKFRELAEKRTTRALESIRIIGNLSNRSLYEWEDVEVKKILKALRESVSEVERSFSTTNSKRDTGFKL